MSVGLQKLLDICGNYNMEWDIKFNPGKSATCTFGGKSRQLEMLNFSHNSYSGLLRLNILDVSLNVLHVKLPHSLLFVNFMQHLIIHCVSFAQKEMKWWLFI